MGWDAFGLPTENYAIRTKKKPQTVTEENTKQFKDQMKRLAYSFDWSREINTTDPDYYKWTQWIFIQLFKHGLANKKEMPINWCPSCKIGLANEEVVGGKCERCGAEVSRRNISQWLVKITKYADRLVEGLKETDFIDKVKQSQINWIGKSEGVKIRFEIVDLPTELESQRISINELEVFTTRPDTLFGATFMVVAPEHKLVTEILANSEFLSEESSRHLEIKKYVNAARKKSDLERTELNKEKTGVFSGLYAINPANGQNIPIWISDFVLAGYGTGAIMSVPAHDERDFAFAKKFGLKIIPVMKPKKGEWNFEKEAYTQADEGKIVNSPLIEGMKSGIAIERMIKWLEDKGIGERASSYHLRDWIFSRQHYWGEPIPMVFCYKCKEKLINWSDIRFQEKIKKYTENNKVSIEILKNNPGWYPITDEGLPLVLPEVEAYEPTDDGKSPLSKIRSFVKCYCPVCGGRAERETDTMPNWAGSDWYFLRYADPKNEKKLVRNDLWQYWGPVDIYIGGDEHNVLHLLYSRFIYQFLREIGEVSAEIKEPYFRRMSHGVILGPDGQRMSKSKGNVIVPETVADEYGHDVVRTYLMFMGPFEATMAWSEKTLMGIKRFLDRMDQFMKLRINQTDSFIDSSYEVKVIINKLIRGITKDLEGFRYNTMIAKMMEGLNSLSSCQAISLSDIKTLIKLMAPVVPYATEEWWSQIGGEESVHKTVWPEIEEKYLIDKQITVAVAVNGKVRSQIEIDSKEVDNRKRILELAKVDEKIIKWLDNSLIVKEIYVPGKMVNFVVVDKK